MGHQKRTNIHNTKALEGDKRERSRTLIQEIIAKKKS